MYGCENLYRNSREKYKLGIHVKLQVLTVQSMEMTVMWDVAPCSLIGINRRFRGAYSLNHQPIALFMEAVNTSETSKTFL
jgi:hypothetical protein